MNNNKNFMPSSRGIALEHGCYYHIYNRRINGTPLFYASDNHPYFLWRYNKYIAPIADTFAWCLMGLHSNLLVRKEEQNEIVINTLSNPVRVNANKTIKPPHLCFSHLFSSYKQAINKQQHRTASIFERPFHHLKVIPGKYFQNLVIYIRQNPVHHGYINFYSECPWPSYGSFMSNKPAKVDRETVQAWFGGKDNFVDVHRKIIELNLEYNL